jgi:hypothetical protein
VVLYPSRSRLSSMSESAADAFRWQAFFQQAAQPMFLVNRRFPGVS